MSETTFEIHLNPNYFQSNRNDTELIGDYVDSEANRERALSLDVACVALTLLSQRFMTFPMHRFIFGNAH